MSTAEAHALPGANMERWLGRRAAVAGPETVLMNGKPMSGVLMLRCSAVSHHQVRAAVRRAGLALSIECAENRREFFEELRRGTTALILAGTESIPDLNLEEIFDRAHKAQPPIPVVLVGGHASEGESLRMLRDATEYLPAGEVERLPMVLARAAKVREFSNAQARAQSELERAAVLLRENQKLITVGRLAASIAHEINNPLEAVTNLLYLLGQDKDLPVQSRGYLALAQRELERVAQISRQTLKFSRETTGPVRTRIDDLMEEVLSLYGRRVEEKNLRIQRQYDCPEEPVVYPGEMRQVLSNLITNAVEASTVRGRLRIRIRCTRSWSDHGVRGIRISVGDNGSGIDPAVQHRLGEPFFTTKGQRGTGLGLWVTRSIIQRYGGEMRLRSSATPERHGTVFSIFLPTNLRPRMVERNRNSDDGGVAGSSGAKVVPLEPGAHARDRVSEASPKRCVNGD